MIHRSLSTLFALLLSAPALAAPEPAAPAAVPEPAPQVLFNFVRPTDVVKVQTNEAFFPELTAKSTPGVKSFAAWCSTRRRSRA